MGYITVTTDVDIDIDDIGDDDLVYSLRHKLEKYSRRENQDAYKTLMRDLKDLAKDNTPDEQSFTDLPGTMLEECTRNILHTLAKKYTLEQLEQLANQ